MSQQLFRSPKNGLSNVEVIFPERGLNFAISSITVRQGSVSTNILLSEINRSNYSITFRFDFKGKPAVILIRTNSIISFASKRFILNIDDRSVQTVFTYPAQSEIIFNVTFSDLGINAQSSNPITEQSPRYLLKSPLQNGSYTESVRELTPEEVSRYRMRGWYVTGTTRGLSPPIKVRGNPAISTVDGYMRVPRRGFTGDFMPVDVKKVMRNVIPKSEKMGFRRMFSEPFRETPRVVYTVEYWNSKGVKRTLTTNSQSSAINYYNRFNAQNLKVRLSYPVYNRNTGKVAYTSKTDNFKKFSSSSSGGNKGGSTNQNTVYDSGSQQNSNEVNQRVQTAEAELRNLKTWITEINARLSKQATDLGLSSTDRSNEIGQLKSYLDEVNDRTSKQLVELGQAVTDVSKALAAAKAENLINSVKNQVGNTGKSAGGFLDNLTSGNNLLIYGFLAVLLIMMVKR